MLKKNIQAITAVFKASEFLIHSALISVVVVSGKAEF
jgi:hypothetical protein